MAFNPTTDEIQEWTTFLRLFVTMMARAYRLKLFPPTHGPRVSDVLGPRSALSIKAGRALLTLSVAEGEKHQFCTNLEELEELMVPAFSWIT